MKIPFLLLTIAGLSCGFQAPLHYKYKYFGSISTGIPELSNQASGWAMKADVDVYVEKNDGSAIFQLSDVKTTEFNDNLGCDSRGDISAELFTYIGDEELSKAVNKPFRAYLFNNEELTMEYPQGKFRWLLNFRKGIVSIFRNEVLKGNMESQTESSMAESMHNGHAINVFNVYEDTTFGNCKVDYTTHHFPKYMKERKKRELREEMELDIQIGESEYLADKLKPSNIPKNIEAEIPTIQEKLFRVIRTVNFDNCKEIVGFQINSIGNSEVTKSQEEYRRGRSSVSELVFRGSPGNARLERAIVEGTTTLAPFGFKSELLEARTNQTLQLVSVTFNENVPFVSDSDQNSKTWMYEVWSFAKPPKYSETKPWVVYTGEGDSIQRFQAYGIDYLSTDQTAHIRNAIIEKIKAASIILTNMEQEETEYGPESPSHLLQDASFLFNFISEETITEIFGIFFGKDLEHSDSLARKLVIDAAAASGNYNAIQTIMSYIREGKIPDLQIMTIFMTLASNAQCPGPLPGILDWVLTLDIKEQPFLTSTVLVNFAHLLNKMCLQPYARNINFDGPIAGDFGCDRQALMQKFQPYVKKLLEDEEDWVKIVGIEILYSIEDPNIFEILAPIIEGKVKCSNKLRIYAIYGLDSWTLDKYDHLKYPIVDLLTYIYNNIGENVAVREAALTVVSEWSPDASFYQTLARISWREPSKRFASFITSLIKFDADYLEQGASHAVKYTKPTAPSLYYSNFFMSSRIDSNRYIKSFDSTSVSKARALSGLRGIDFYSSYEFGGHGFTLFESSALYKIGLYAKTILSDLGKSALVNETAVQLAKDFYNKIEESLKSKVEEPEMDDFLYIDFTFFNHLRVFLPINGKTAPKLPFNDYTKMAELLVHLNSGYDLVLGKFLNPVAYTMVHPTELGLPLFISGSTPTVFSETSYTSLTSGGNEPTWNNLDKAVVSSKYLMSVSSEYRSSISVLLPWSQKLIKTGITSARDITVPLKADFASTAYEQFGKTNYFDFNYESLYKEKYSVVKASNTPYTSIVPMLPLEEITTKPIFSKAKPKETAIPIPNKYTGLDFHLTLKSESSLPYTLFTPDELFSFPDATSPLLFYAYASPTTKYWNFNLEFDPKTSATKRASYKFSTGKIERNDSDFYQYGRDDFKEYDSANPEKENEKSGVVGDETVGNINDGGKQNISGSPVTVNGLRFDFIGDENRHYEVMISSKKSKVSDSRKVKKMHVYIKRSPIPNMDKEFSTVCIDFQKSFPIISKIQTLEDLLKENLDKEIKVEVSIDCKAETALVAKGSYHISDEWKAKYQNQLKESCDFDPIDPMYTFNHHAVYDDIKFTYTWEKVCDPLHHPVMTKVFDFGKQLFINGIFNKKCGSEEPERKIETNVHRCPINGNWYIDIHREDIEVSYKNLPHTNEFNVLFGVTDKDHEFYPDHYTTFNRESDKCIVEVDRVRTFDGFTFDYKPSHCWSVAVKNCLTNNKMLLVRSSKGAKATTDAKYIDTHEGLIIEYIENTLKVNGKVVDSTSGKETIKNIEGENLAIIYKSKGYYIVKFNMNSYITFKDRIEVSADFMKWIDTCGLCGSKDGEPENDLVGPDKCYYIDYNLFAASWTAESDECDSSTLQELRKGVEEFSTSKSCKHSDIQKCSKFDSVCMKHDWNVTYYDEDICISSLPIPYCDDSCDISEFHDVLVKFYCWPRENAPEVLQDELGFNENQIHEPFRYEHHWEDEKYISFPKYCKQY